MMPIEKTANAGETPSENTEAQSNEQTTTPTPDSGSVEKETVSASTLATSDPVDKSAQFAERDAKKMSELERKAKDLETRWQNVQRVIHSDPEVMYKAYRETSGLPEDQVINYVKATHPQWTPSIQQPQTGNFIPQQPVLTPTQMAALSELEQKKALEDEKVRQIATKFVEDHPELDNTDHEAIMAGADALVKKGKNHEEALMESYSKWTGKEYKQGEVEGMAKAFSATPASSGGVSGGSSQKGTPAVSADDEAVMRRLGLSQSERETFQKFTQKN